MSEIGVPAGVPEMTPEWMTSVLTTSGHLREGRVASVSAQPIGIGRGYASQNLRLNLTYDDAGAGPASLFAKLPMTFEIPPEAKALIGQVYTREINWYRELKADTPVRTPAMVWSGMEPEAWKFCLLLEDLGHFAEKGQVASCSTEEARLAVRTLGRVHAAWWESDRLANTPWLPTSAQQATLVQSMWQAAWPGFWEIEGPRLSPEFEAVGLKTGAAIPTLMEKGSASGRTLVHGDYRIENFLFGPPGTDDELVVLDWQVVSFGNGLRDLAYFIGQNLEEASRREQEQELLRLYYSELVRGGVTGYSFDRCYDDYRTGLLLAMYIAISAVGTVVRQFHANPVQQRDAAFQQVMESGQRLIRAIVSRNVAAILENRAEEMLV